MYNKYLKYKKKYIALAGSDGPEPHELTEKEIGAYGGIFYFVPVHDWARQLHENGNKLDNDLLYTIFIYTLAKVYVRMIIGPFLEELGQLEYNFCEKPSYLFSKNLFNSINRLTSNRLNIVGSDFFHVYRYINDPETNSLSFSLNSLKQPFITLCSHFRTFLGAYQACIENTLYTDKLLINFGISYMRLKIIIEKQVKHKKANLSDKEITTRTNNISRIINKLQELIYNYINEFLIHLFSSFSLTEYNEDQIKTTCDTFHFRFKEHYNKLISKLHEQPIPIIKDEAVVTYNLEPEEFI